MRLLWEETGFELVGAFCVAAFSFGAAWIFFTDILGLTGIAAGLLATGAAAAALEAISRRHYADRRGVSRPRPVATRPAPAAAPRGAAQAPPAAGPSRAGRPALTPSQWDPAREPGRREAPGLAPRKAAARRRAA